MITVYCYARCSTCKAALKWLDEHHVAYHSKDIVMATPTAAQFEQWFVESDRSVKSFFNTSGQHYRAQKLKDKLATMTPAEQAALLASDGMLIKRPLVVGPDFVLSGFKTAQFEQLLQK